MFRTRVIPVLLLKNQGLVKTVKFKDPKYVGDPINAVKIFNEKEVDELAILDIEATTQKREPNYELIESIASEAFMPIAYGGGVSKLEQISKLIRLGVEKIIINSAAVTHPSFVEEATSVVGSQSIVVSIDVKKNFFGKYEVVSHAGSQRHSLHPVEHAIAMEKRGAGELVINSIDKDGMMTGYDLVLIKSITDKVGIPVIALGGAASVADFKTAIDQGGASAVAAGSMFVFYGKHRAVLITYPTNHNL